MEQRLIQRCSVCKQDVDFWRRHTAGVLGLVLGAERYAVCCCCKQPVKDHVDAGYRRRFKRQARRQKAQSLCDAEKRRQEREHEERSQREANEEDAQLMYGPVKV